MIIANSTYEDVLQAVHSKGEHAMPTSDPRLHRVKKTQAGLPSRKQTPEPSSGLPGLEARYSKKGDKRACVRC